MGELSRKAEKIMLSCSEELQALAVTMSNTELELGPGYSHGSRLCRSVCVGSWVEDEIGP